MFYCLFNESEENHLFISFQFKLSNFKLLSGYKNKHYMHQLKRILVCPLNWGLGHATRCIPLIRLLLEKGADVIIAADGRPLELLKLEFPDQKFIIYPGYNITYPDNGSMFLQMMLSVRKIAKGIKQEHSALNKIVDDHKIDVVISDNRYGCWNKKAKNIFITHQLMIKAPFAEFFLHRIVLNHIKNYDECWIPDIESEANLSGDLSHQFQLPDNSFFVGYLSRFNIPVKSYPKENSLQFDYRYDLMVIISGPEPQRSNLEKIILQQTSNINLKTLIVLGKPEKMYSETTGNITIASHLNTAEMKEAILNSEIIISRSGYSTIMDLAVLNKKAIFIPTPGQTEQEYLAKILMKQKIAFSATQSSFELKKALKASENYSGLKKRETSGLLEQRINAILF